MKLKPIPEVHSETPIDKVRKENRVKSAYEEGISTDLGNGFTLDSPELPDAYNKLSQVDTSKVLSKQRVYTMIEKFTPYLVQNLLYLSQHPQSSPRDRANASKILLDKVVPNLNADHIKLEGDGVQSLVIVKAGAKNEE